MIVLTLWIFHLYRGDQFYWWRKTDYAENTIYIHSFQIHYEKSTVFGNVSVMNGK